MYHLPDFLYEINLLSVSLRLILALLFGGIIGLERGSNRHPAGFRTHILVCVGAALAMMTNQFILQQFDTGDPARLGAQVITNLLIGLLFRRNYRFFHKITCALHACESNTPLS